MIVNVCAKQEKPAFHHIHPEAVLLAVVSEHSHAEGTLATVARIKVLIAEDNMIVREGIARMLESQVGIEVVKQTRTGAGAGAITRTELRIANRGYLGSVGIPSAKKLPHVEPLRLKLACTGKPLKYKGEMFKVLYYHPSYVGGTPPMIRWMRMLGSIAIVLPLHRVPNTLKSRRSMVNVVSKPANSPAPGTACTPMVFTGMVICLVTP